MGGFQFGLYNRFGVGGSVFGGSSWRGICVIIYDLRF
jgi:hypothetical protein